MPYRPLVAQWAALAAFSNSCIACVHTCDSMQQCDCVSLRAAVVCCRLAKHMLVGELEKYRGEAVNPKHLSMWEK